MGIKVSRQPSTYTSLLVLCSYVPLSRTPRISYLEFLYVVSL